jgi:hypothetical protein
MRREPEKVVTMNIVINDEVVGELTDDGEIITNYVWLQILEDRITRHNLTDLRGRKAKKDHYFYLLPVKKGDPDYRSTAADILLDNGYGFK